MDAPLVDVVVVAYNSRATLRAAVEPLCGHADARVVVVDNASPDDSPAVVADLPLEVVAAGRNGGFAVGSNIGAATGAAPYILLLNPDATIAIDDLRTLVAVLDAAPAVGLAAPRLEDPDGTLLWSQRRFARPRSTWAQALFLHRAWPRASWTDELIRDPAAYRAATSPQWVSGACMLIRRSAWEQIGGLDERYFLYCEDMDLCRRLRDDGHDVRYEPAAAARHVGGASSSSGETLAIAAHSRVLYARRHLPRGWATVERAGIALSAATHVLSSARRPALRRGHARALRTVLGARP